MSTLGEQAPSTLLSAEAGSLDHYSRIHQRIAKVNHELHLELLAAHGESEELLRFAAQCNEWERVLSHHVDERNAPAAIEVLRGVRRARAETPAEVERLIALTSHELLELAPAGTVDAWLQGRLMNAGKLLPAVMSYDRRAAAGATPPPEHQGIRYLRASGSELAAVHNCLVLLHARRSDDATLLRYLSGAPSDDDLTDIASTLANAPSNAVPAPASSAFSGPDVGVDSAPLAAASKPVQRRHEFSPPPYDLNYAARTCIAHERFEACVFLYQARCRSRPCLS